MTRTPPSLHDALEILRTKRTRPQRRPPPPAGRALAPLIRSLEAKYGKGPGALKSRWPEIVGANLAKRTEPVKVIPGRGGAAGVLEIRVEGAFAPLIQHQSAQILDRVNLILGAGAAQRLRIVQGPVKSAAVRPAPRKRPPLDAGKEAEIAASLESLPEGPLKRSLMNLGREVFRGRPK